MITGGNSGIGKATAVDLAKRQAKVIIACRTAVTAQECVSEIKELSGNEQVLCYTGFQHLYFETNLTYVQFDVDGSQIKDLQSSEHDKNAGDDYLFSSFDRLGILRLCPLGRVQTSGPLFFLFYLILQLRTTYIR